MEKKKLLSIGQLSKLTGVHIKSLRYYDRIGILRPAFVDPENGYRYYTFPQIHLVEAIQLCVDLDIPLKRFTEFLAGEDGHQIRYDRLIAFATKLIGEKMRAFRQQLHFLRRMQMDIDHAERCYMSGAPLRCLLPEKVCWTTPYNGNQGEGRFHAVFSKAISDITGRGLKVGYEIGLLLLWPEGRPRQYLYVDVEAAPALRAQFPEICVLPAADYLCRKAEKSAIASAPEVFPALFEGERKPVVIETELFTGTYNFQHPLYELRCLAAPR